MRIIIHSFCAGLICFGSILLFSGCKERGCTNPAAINYNSVAEEDDGTCIVCQTTYESLGIKSRNLVDNNFSSPHFNQSVALFTIEQQRISYNNNVCGGSAECIIIVSATSLVNESMQILYDLQSSGSLSFSFNDLIDLAPNQFLIIDTMTASNISNPCGNINSSTLNIFLNENILYY